MAQQFPSLLDLTFFFAIGQPKGSLLTPRDDDHAGVAVCQACIHPPRSERAIAVMGDKPTTGEPALPERDARVERIVMEGCYRIHRGVMT